VHDKASVFLAPLFVVHHAPYREWIQPVLRRLPPFSGEPVRIEMKAGLRDHQGAAHAGSFLRDRRIGFNCNRREFRRIFVHEVFHFVWVRLGNPSRWSYEELLLRELAAGASGELGWSAEWRKHALVSADWRNRGRRWREYCCESFCDSAAWLYSGIEAHAEFTLARRFRNFRQEWFAGIAKAGPLSI
jgi:hypothetical protein